MSARPTEAAEQPRLFTSTRQPLDRLARVRPGTVVIMFDGERPPRLRRPGELLVPSWIPFLAGIDVVIVTTDTIEVEITLDDVAAADGERIHRITLLVMLRLLDDEQHSGLIGLAERYGGEFGLSLARGVQTEFELAVRSAIRMHDLADIRRQSLLKVLREAWLPYNVVDDLVEVQGLSIGAVEWAGETEAASPAPTEARPWIDPYQDESYVEHDDIDPAVIASDDDQRSGVSG